MTRRPLIAGNWKMFGRKVDLAEIATLKTLVGHVDGVDVVVCPPATLLAAAAAAAGPEFAVGGQDCRAGGDGAFTGDLNAAMLADAGARWCIVGHSERRQGYKESDGIVAEKAKAAMAAGLTPIICVGESLEERKAGKAAEVVADQIRASVPAGAPAATVIAYEPIWAIGTGLTPTLDEIGEIHGAARRALPVDMRILYGGSVKPGNAADIFRVAGVDGALVGGASLKAADFSAIVLAHPAAARR